MAEIIGLVASIVALAETGFKISKSISQIAIEFGTAGAQIKAIGTDTRAVSLILREIPKRLKRARSVAAEVQQVAADIVALCKSDVDDIEEFLKSLQPMQGSEVSIKQKTKWLFTKSKVSLRRASLDSLKLTLSLFIHTLEFIESGEVDEHIKDEVDNLISDSKNAKKDLLNAEHADQKTERAYQTNQGANTSGSLRIQSSEAFNHDAVDENSTSANAPMDIEICEVEDMDTDENKQLQLYDPQTNLTLMQNMSDDHFLLIAEHLRVQKLVSSFALIVMDPMAGFLDGEDRKAVKPQAFPSSASHRGVGVDDYLTPVPSYQEPPRGHAAQSPSDFLGPDNQRPSSATPSRTPSLDRRLDGNIAMGVLGERRGSTQHSNLAEDSSESRDIEVESHRVGDPVKSSHELIRFRFDIPSEDTWYPMLLAPDIRRMHENIMETTHHVNITEVEYALIEDQEYILVDPGNQILLPKFWEHTVKPGTDITLRLNPSEFKRSGSKYKEQVASFRIRVVGDEKPKALAREAMEGQKGSNKYLRVFKR